MPGISRCSEHLKFTHFLCFSKIILCYLYIFIVFLLVPPVAFSILFGDCVFFPHLNTATHV